MKPDSLVSRSMTCMPSLACLCRHPASLLRHPFSKAVLFFSPLCHQNGNAAASLTVAEQYVNAFSKLAKDSNTILLPSNPGDVTSMVAQVRAPVPGTEAFGGLGPWAGLYFLCIG